LIHITDKLIDTESVTNSVRSDSNGAVITFLGTTRDTTAGRTVRYLEYEAYRPMADQTLKQIVNEINERWSIRDVAIAHRLGRLEIGDISLVVAVSAPHRKDAFLACQYSVDRIKQIVPIWKKEMFEDGEIWVGSDGEHYLSKSFNETLDS